MTVSPAQEHKACWRHESWEPGCQRDDETDEEYQDRLLAAVRESALTLLHASKVLGWGSGEPYYDAIHWLTEAAEANALLFRYKQPRPKPRVVRKQLSPGVVRKVWDRDGWECKHCGTHRDLTVDHVIPLLLGGTDDLGNLQTLCHPCNSRKGARA